MLKVIQMLCAMYAKYLTVVVLLFLTKSTLCLHLGQDGMNTYKINLNEPAPLDVSLNEEEVQDKLDTIMDSEVERNEGRVKRQAQIQGYQHLYPQVPSAPPYNPYQPQAGNNQPGPYNGYPSQGNTQQPQQWNPNIYNPSQPGYLQPYNSSGHNQYGGSIYGPGGLNGQYPAYNQTNIRPPFSSSNRPNNTYNQYTTPRSPYGNNVYNNSRPSQPGYPGNTYPGNQHHSHNFTSQYPTQWPNTPSSYPNNYDLNNSFYNPGQQPHYGNSGNAQWGSGGRNPNNQGGQFGSGYVQNPQTGFYTNNNTNQHHGQNGNFVYDPNNVVRPGNHSHVYNPVLPSPYGSNSNQYPNQYPQNNYNG